MKNVLVGQAEGILAYFNAKKQEESGTVQNGTGLRGMVRKNP
jgi:hypothetical protein